MKQNEKTDLLLRTVGYLAYLREHNLPEPTLQWAGLFFATISDSWVELLENFTKRAKLVVEAHSDEAKKKKTGGG